VTEQPEIRPVGVFEIWVTIANHPPRRLAEGGLAASPDHPNLAHSTLPQSLRMIANAVENGHAN
jgi:hypothetical protein